jgi:hypothetical protein
MKHSIFRITVLAVTLLLLFIVSPAALAQSPTADPEAVKRELTHLQQRIAQAPLAAGSVAAQGGRNDSRIEGLVIRTDGSWREPELETAGYSVPRMHEYGEEVYRMAKEAARSRAPVVSNSMNTDRAALTGSTIPNAPLAPPFLGVSYEAVYYTGWIPPDPIIAVTPTDVIVAYNSGFSIYDKSNPGSVLFSTTFASWWSGFGLPSGTVIFDPKLVYDYINNRVIIVSLARNTTVNKSWFLVSVSLQPSATGSYWGFVLDATYDGSTPTNNWADYPGVGTDGTNLYISANMFSFSSGTFQYAKVRMLKLSELYNGSISSGWWDFWGMTHQDSVLAFTVQPAHHYFSGPPMYLVSAENNLSSSSGNVLTTFYIALPTNNNWPTYSPVLYRLLTITTASSFSVPPDAGQPGTSTLINTGDDRILSARYYGGDIWLTQGCARGSNAGLCIYGFTIGGTKFYDMHGWGATGSDYYYPSIAVDRYENIAIVFSRSSSTYSEYASIRYTGLRNYAAYTNSNLEPSAQIKGGEATYVALDSSGRNRWGDYSGIERDPAAGQVFWLFHEYAKPQVSGNSRWGTWIATVGYNQIFLPFIRK